MTRKEQRVAVFELLFEREFRLEESAEENLNFFQKIWKAIVDFFKKLFGIKDDE